MARYAIVDPDGIQYDWLTADGPLEALHRLHAEALGFDAVAWSTGISLAPIPPSSSCALAPGGSPRLRGTVTRRSSSPSRRPCCRPPDAARADVADDAPGAPVPVLSRPADERPRRLF
jgi:hypothetical protein